MSAAPNTTPNTTADSKVQIPPTAALPMEPQARQAAIRERIMLNTRRMTIQIARELNVPEVEVVARCPKAPRGNSTSSDGSS